MKKLINFKKTVIDTTTIPKEMIESISYNNNPNQKSNKDRYIINLKHINRTDYYPIDYHYKKPAPENNSFAEMVWKNWFIFKNHTIFKEQRYENPQQIIDFSAKYQIVTTRRELQFLGITLTSHNTQGLIELCTFKFKDNEFNEKYENTLKEYYTQELIELNKLDNIQKHLQKIKNTKK